MNDGFIKLFRSLEDWEWYKDQNTKDLFIHLLIKASWKESRYRGHEVPKGSVVTGIHSLAESLGISEQSIRTSLKHLKSTGEITIKSTNRFSIISIANWEKFQGYSEELTSQLTSQLTNNQQAANKQLTTYKEYKNIRNKEEKKEKPKNQFCNFTQQNYDWDEINRELGIK
jgi:hypothetical protein